MPRKPLALALASLAATLVCFISTIGCSNAAGNAVTSHPASTSQAAAAGQPATGGQPAAEGQPAVASLPAQPSQPGQPAVAGQATGKQYYLALGDSLAAGYQPDQVADQGYANQLVTRLRAHGSVLSLDNLGCGGETTQTMIQGGVCSYPGEPSQLQAALGFLRAHPGHVPLITIDIGGNDMNPCDSLSSVSSADACTDSLNPAMSKNLTAILKALRAADPSAVIAGLNYYVPELAGWLDGSSGQAFAAAQLSATKVMNAVLAADYKAAKARYVDVFSTFQSDELTSETTLAGYGRLPVAVARVCEWSWMCSGGDEHANTEGYGVIAAAIYAVLPASVAR